MKTLRTETRNGVRHLVLCRAAEYNTITPALRDELATAIDAADDDRDVRVILLRAEGRAFCAGYGLDWSTAAEAQQVTYTEATLQGGRHASDAALSGGARSEAKASEPSKAHKARGGEPPPPDRPKADPHRESNQRVWDS